MLRMLVQHDTALASYFSSSHLLPVVIPLKYCISFRELPNILPGKERSLWDLINQTLNK